MNSFGPLSSNKFKFDSAKWASNVYDEVSIDASTKIKTAMIQFKRCLQGRRTLHADNTAKGTNNEEDDNCDEVLPDLNVCKNSTALGYERLYRAVLNTYLAVSKFNYPWIEKYPTADPLDDLINKTLAATTAGQVLRVPLLAASWANGSAACIDAFNGNLSRASAGSVESAQPAWAYVSCGCYPVNDVSIPSGNVLPEAHARGPVDLCARQAWRAADYGRENEYFLQKYALTNDMLDTADRLLIVQGRYDRTAAIGSPVLTVTDRLNHSRVVLVHGAAHAEDTFSEAVEPRGLKPQIDEVRASPLPRYRVNTREIDI